MPLKPFAANHLRSLWIRFQIKSIARAKAEAEGKEFKDGRKKVYDEERLDHALDLLNDYSYTQVTKLTGISKSTLIRHKRKKELEKN